MPLFYQGRCRNCAHETKLTPDGYLALRINNSEFKMIGHPGEEYDLEEAGYTFQEAKEQDRLVRVHLMSCNQCGQVAEQYKQRTPEAPPFGTLFLFLMIEIGIMFSEASLPWKLFDASMLAATIYALKVEWIASRIQQKPIAVPQLTWCPHCGGQKFRHIGWGYRFTCLECKKPTLKSIPSPKKRFSLA